MFEIAMVHCTLRLTTKMNSHCLFNMVHFKEQKIEICQRGLLFPLPISHSSTPLTLLKIATLRDYILEMRDLSCYS